MTVSIPPARRAASGSRRRALARATTSVGLLGGLLAGLLGPVAPVVAAATPAPTTVAATTPAPTITLYGRGFGHGVGMSQYGARGRALAGQAAGEILAHYYQGATILTGSPGTKVRVLVLPTIAASAAKPLRLVGHGATWTISGRGPFPAEAALRVTRTGRATLALTVTEANGTVLLKLSMTTAELLVQPTSDAGRIEVVSKASTYDTYRGTIHIRGVAGGLIAVNELGMDDYLRGVLPLEMPSSWPAEALKAQAIAARSYALRRLHPTVGTYDLTDGSSSQLYRGSLAESAATDAAISATGGQVLVSGRTIVNAVYDSTGGGATENSENAWPSSSGRIVAGPVSYLRGSPDRDPTGVSYDAAAPHATWQSAPYTMAQLSGFFATDSRTKVGTLTAMDLSKVGVSGRLISVKLTGSGGTKTVSGEVFRSVLNAATPATDPYLWSTLIATAPIP